MQSSEVDQLHSHTHLSRFAANLGERDRLYQRQRRGEVVRVFRGCFVDATFWAAISPAERHRSMAHLAALVFRSDLVFSHHTAAALWRLPILGQWPERVHIAGPKGGAARRSATLARHALGIEIASEPIDGLLLTPLATTVAHIAATESFAAGVVVADAALRLDGSLDLAAAASQVARNRGGARALAVAEFADSRADRPGESISRASIRAAGLAAPELQVELHGASGSRYVVDFYWRELRLIGEFDGAAKYNDPQFLRGRTPEQALLDEKAREDDLRATDHGFSRWGWSVALSPARLGTQLRRAGVR